MIRMARQSLIASACAAVAAACLGACGSGGPTTPSPSPRSTATPAPTPTLPPDPQTVDITATGVGAWQLVAVPVAVLHNNALRHGAEGVVVHFTTKTAGGRPQHSLDSLAVNIAPNTSLVVTADCTDVCNDAASVVASVDVGRWVPTAGVSFTATPAHYACSAGCGGRQSGEVSTTLTATRSLTAGTQVTVFADCAGPQGAILGGGSAQVSWPGGASAPVTVSTIVNRAPASCTVSASTSW